MAALQQFFGDEADVEDAGFDANAAFDQGQAQQVQQGRRGSNFGADVSDTESRGRHGKRRRGSDAAFEDFFAKRGAKDTDVAQRLRLHADTGSDSDSDSDAEVKTQVSCCARPCVKGPNGVSVCDFAVAALGVATAAAGISASVFAIVLLAVERFWRDALVSAAQGAGLGVALILGGAMVASLALRGYRTGTASALAVLVLSAEAGGLFLLSGDDWGNTFVYVVAGTHVVLLGLVVVVFFLLSVAAASLHSKQALVVNKTALPASAFSRDQKAFRKERLMAAKFIQRVERGRRARQQRVRLMEWRLWQGLSRERGVGTFLAHLAAVVYIAVLLYLSWVHGSKFQHGLTETWVAACVVAALLEALVVEPTTILIRCIMYDVWPIVTRRRAQLRLQRMHEEARIRRAAAAQRAAERGAPHAPKKGWGSFHGVSVA